MSDERDDDSGLLFRPSKLPNDREYERAQQEQSQLFTPSRISKSDNAEKENRHYEKQYKQARFEAKTEVLRQIPPLLDKFIQNLDQEEAARGTFSRRIYWLVLGWLGFIAGLVLLSGIELDINGLIIDLQLNDGVLIALVTGATVSLVGLLATVISYFFTKTNEQISLYRGLFSAMLDQEQGEE